MFNTIISIFFIKVQNTFGIGTGPKLMASLDQVRIQIREVMRFAIKHNPERFILVRDRLIAAFYVNNSEPPHSQTNAWFEMETIAIRATMHNGLCHGLNRMFFGCLMIRIG